MKIILHGGIRDMASPRQSNQTKSKVKMPDLPFKVGDMAVYPAHGVGEVKSIESREISGSRQVFYVLQILDSGMKIMVPTSNVNAVGTMIFIPESKICRT